MKIVLLSIDAKYIHTNNAVRLLKANSTFPMEILEYTIKDNRDEIIKDIKSYEPDVIGCSVYIWNVEIIRDLLTDPYFQTMHVILGGPEVSYDPHYFLSLQNVDFIIRGEGEQAFDVLLQRLDTNQPYSDVSNLAYKGKDNVMVNPIQEIHDLSTIQMGHYFKEDLPHIKHKITYIESSRGCPYNCSYCLSSLEKTVRFFPLNTVKEVIDYAISHGSNTIKFLDRTFNANRHTLAIIDHIITVDNGVTVFQFEITGDVLDKTLVDYINTHARNGLFRFEIGIQSTNELTNKLVDRHQNNERLFERINQIQKAGIIDLHLDLIAGLPQEDKASFIQTFNDVYFLGGKELQLGFLKMLRGTKIRREANLYGYVYHTTSPYEIIENDVLSKDDIDEIKLVEHMLEIYHNKGYFGTHLHTYILAQPSPYHFFLQLGKHYTKNNYKMHAYQLEDVYKHIFDVVDEETGFLLKQDYLMRSTIKPKIFFENNVPKAIKNKILTTISNDYNIPIHLLYKHSVLIRYNEDYYCAYYKGNVCQSYKGKAPN